MADPNGKPTVVAGKVVRPPNPDEVMPHLKTPVDVKLSVGFSADPTAATRSAAGAADPFASALPADSMARLRALEPQVMQWLAVSDSNRQLFLNDPVAAL